MGLFARGMSFLASFRNQNRGFWSSSSSSSLGGSSSREESSSEDTSSRGEATALSWGISSWEDTVFGLGFSGDFLSVTGSIPTDLRIVLGEGTVLRSLTPPVAQFGFSNS